MAFSAQEEKDLIHLMPNLLGYCTAKMKHNPDDGADLCQTVLAKAWANKDKFESGSNLRAWLFTIANNQFYDDLRHSKGHTLPSTMSEQQIDRRLQGASKAPRQLDSVVLKETLGAIQNLPQKQAQAMFMVAVEGYSYEEAATDMNTAIGTVKSHVSRGRNSLSASHHDFSPR